METFEIDDGDYVFHVEGGQITSFKEGDKTYAIEAKRDAAIVAVLGLLVLLAKQLNKK